MPWTVCNNIEVDLNGAPCPVPLRIRELGNAVTYNSNEHNHYVGAFVWYGPNGEFDFHFPVTDYSGFTDIANDKARMLQPHTMVVRFLDPHGTPVKTVNLTAIMFTLITYEFDAAGPYLRVRGIPQVVGM